MPGQTTGVGYGGNAYCCSYTDPTLLTKQDCEDKCNADAMCVAYSWKHSYTDCNLYDAAALPDLDEVVGSRSLPPPQGHSGANCYISGGPTRCVQPCGADKYLSQACSSKITVSGGCASWLRGTYTKQGSTASGAPYYTNGPYWLYWDPNSCNAGSGGTGRWIFDDNEPSTTATSDLDGDGKCYYYAYTDSTDSSSPPRGLASWEIWCSPAWTSAGMTIVEKNEAGACTTCSNIKCNAGNRRRGSCTSRAAGCNSVAASALGRAPSCLALEAQLAPRSA